MPRNKKRYKKVFYIDAKQEHRWRILSPNGRIMADCGEGYKRMIDAKRALDRLLHATYDLLVMGVTNG
jgi:uncharacterized protein YegP (UPF0339 family)